MSDNQDRQELSQLVNICFWITVLSIVATRFISPSTILGTLLLIVAATSGVLLVVFHIVRAVKYDS